MTNDPKAGAAADPQPPQDPQATPPASTTATPQQETPTTALTTQPVQDPASPAPAQVPAQAPPAAPPVKRTAFDVFAPVRDRIVAMYSEEWFQKEASYMLSIINASDYLQKSTMASRLAALMQLANTGLTLNPVMKFAYLVPRNVKVKGEGGERWEIRLFLEPSYMGMIKAATDAGSVKLIRAEVVYEGDGIDIVKGTHVQIVHTPYWKMKNERGEAIAAYSVAVLHDGTVDILDMGRDELEKIKASSEAVKKGNASPYDTWLEEMMRKAPIRRHLKTLPKTERMEKLMHAIAADEEQYGSAVAQSHRTAGAIGEARGIQLQLAERLDAYTGDDRETIRTTIQERVRANTFTVEYGKEMLAKISGEKNS